MPRNAKFSTNSKIQDLHVSRHQLVAQYTFLGEKHLNLRDLNYMAQHKFKCQQMTLKWNPNNSVLKIVSDCTGTCQNTNWWSNQVEPASQILWAVSLLLHHHLSTLIFLVCWLSVILFNVKTWKFQWGGVLDIYLFKGSQKCRELGLCGHVMVEENKSCFALAQNGDVYPIVPNAEIEKSSKCLIVLKVIVSLIITDILIISTWVFPVCAVESWVWAWKWQEVIQVEGRQLQDLKFEVSPTVQGRGYTETRYWSICVVFCCFGHL